VLGDTGTPGAACPALPATGSERYDWQWDGTNMTLLSCAANPPAATQAVSVGGTGQNAVSSWPIVAVHSTTMSGNFTESMQSAWVTSELVTVTATGVITLGAAGWAGQTLNMLVCQNATGNFNVSFAVSGVTVVGTFPQITTLASQCGDLTVHYITTTSAYLYGSQNGPLGASTISGTFVNACKANVTLSSGSGTFSNACVLTTSACFAQDITTPANSCKPQVPTNGSVAVSGTGSDVCVTACE
jgi:hypothetical protein